MLGRGGGGRELGGETAYGARLARWRALVRLPPRLRVSGSMEALGRAHCIVESVSDSGGSVESGSDSDGSVESGSDSDGSVESGSDSDGNVESGFDSDGWLGRKCGIGICSLLAVWLGWGGCAG